MQRDNNNDNNNNKNNNNIKTKEHVPVQSCVLKSIRIWGQFLKVSTVNLPFCLLRVHLVLVLLCSLGRPLGVAALVRPLGVAVDH